MVEVEFEPECDMFKQGEPHVFFKRNFIKKNQLIRKQNITQCNSSNQPSSKLELKATNLPQSVPHN